MFLRAHRKPVCKLTWLEALPNPHSLLDCADEVIEYHKTVAMHVSLIAFPDLVLPAGNQTKARCGS